MQTKEHVSAADVFAEIQSIATENHVILAHHSSYASIMQYSKTYQLAQAFLPHGSKVLDWGVGNGHFSLFCVLAGFKTHGFSIFEKAVYKNFIDCINLRHADRFDYLLGTPDQHKINLPYPDNSFDGVFSVGVLEHVREVGGNELSSLREHFRILKSGGVMICTAFPNKFSYIEFLRKGHLYKYTLQDIHNYAAAVGFAVERMGRYQFLPRVILNRMPASLANNKIFVHLYNALDKAMERALNLFCTSNYFVFRKPV